MFKHGKLISGNKIIDNLSQENDMFGTIQKAENLISIFQDMPNEIDDIQMIGIYGEWGSGKTTYMKHVCNELNKIKNVDKKRVYKSIMFEAWKFEFDDSLHISLMECISETTSTIQEDILKDCFSFLKNIALNSKISLNVPFLNIVGLEVDTGKAIESTIYNNEPLSLYKKVEEFRKSYKKLIDDILIDQGVEKLVICIDDLDRCEPENVINLLSVIKHFFMYDERVKFICMLDKDAVSKAFLTKYGDVVKSKEYLEKIFDLNFTLMDSEDISKVINHYIESDEDTKLVEEFFKKMGIINPRRMIKILNRSLFLERFLFKTNKYKEIFIDSNGKIENENSNCKVGYNFKENSFLYSMLLYFVIYKEYYPDEFSKMFNFEEKLENLRNTFQAIKVERSTEPIFSVDSFFDIIRQDLNDFTVRVNGYILDYECTKNFSSYNNSPTLKVDPFFYIFMPFFKEHNVTDINVRKESLIISSRGIDNDIPYNFINMYYKENYINNTYSNTVDKRMFVIEQGTSINIYKLYKFVKDN